VDYKDPTEIPSQPDSLEVTGSTGAQQILNKIAIGEGATVDKLNQQKQFGIGTSKYDMVYNYGKSLAPSKPVSTMTLSELYDFQTNLINATKGKVKGTTLGTSAVGKYQILRTSLFGSGTAENPMENSWAEKLGLKADTVFSPELQEQIGMLALEEAGLKSFIQGTRNENQFQDRIANIWASVATSSGGDVYGQGVATFKKDLMPLFQKVKDQNRPDDFSDPVEVPEGRGEPIKPKIRPEQ
jgi:muramidase (phage lysozyme)